MNNESFNKRAAKYGLTAPTRIVLGQDIIHEIEALDVEVVSDKTIAFTVDKAVEYINYPIFRGERLVDDRHVQELIMQCKRKRFNWTNVILASCEYGGDVYKVNGSHTSPQTHPRHLTRSSHVSDRPRDPEAARPR